MGRIVGVTLIVLGVYVFESLIRHGREFRMRSRWMLVFAGVRSAWWKLTGSSLVDATGRTTTSVSPSTRTPASAEAVDADDRSRNGITAITGARGTTTTSTRSRTIRS